MSRNLVLAWDPHRKGFDAGMSFPGKFNDSNSTRWHHSHDHMISLPDERAIVCYCTFATSRKLKGDMIKSKESNLEEIDERIEKDKTLTYAR